MDIEPDNNYGIYFKIRLKELNYKGQFISKLINGLYLTEIILYSNEI